MQLNARQDPSNDSTVRSALIVDDDARLRRLLVDFLEQSNWQTYEAADGIDALEAARLHHPSIIILDLMMPRLDGMETCRRLRQVSQVPIIMLTARDDEVDKLLGLELGADDYLVKPFSMRELAARMNAISARLAQLRGERRRLTENAAIDETMDALRKVEQTLLNGPERLDGFDEELFEHLVEKIIAESQNRIRFRLYGGLELTEQWEVAAR